MRAIKCNCLDKKGLGLTKLQHRFVLAYVGDANRVGYKAHQLVSSGTPSKQTSAVQASKWLSMPNVRASLQIHTAKVEEKVEQELEKRSVITKTRAVELLVGIAENVGAQDRDRIAAVRQIAVMMPGWVAPTRSQVSTEPITGVSLSEIAEELSAAAKRGDATASEASRTIVEAKFDPAVVAKTYVGWLRTRSTGETVN